MTQINEFESIFRRAEREPFVYSPPKLGKIVVVTDRDRAFGQETVDAVKAFLPVLAGGEFEIVSNEQYSTVGELTNHIERLGSDLIVTFRHLQEASLVPQHSLGVYVDVLTQTQPAPVLLLPGTAADPELPSAAARSVLVLTDHIRGDARLISSAAVLTPPDAPLHLAHVEDDVAFERYLSAIDRIPELNSDVARDQLESTLLNDAEHYMDAAVAGLTGAGVPHETSRHITRGHRLQTFQSLMDETAADLCVLNTKDDGQLAMHGMAYAVAVETVHRALYML